MKAVSGMLADLTLGSASSDWEGFIHADSIEARCRAWLALLCKALPDVRTAAVLVERPSEHSYAPLAIWPEGASETARDMARLGAVIEQALRERRDVALDISVPCAATHIAWPFFVGERIAGVVALETSGSESDHGETGPAMRTAILRELHWGGAWLVNLLGERERGEAIRTRERLQAVLEITAALLRHATVRQALFEVVHRLRQHFGCARVAIGMAREMRVRLVALSEAATFEKHSPLVNAYEEAMEEACDTHTAVQSPVPEGAGGQAPKHEALRIVSGSGAVLSFPLVVGARCVGVVTLEREDGGFGADDLDWLDAFGALAAAIIEQRRMAEEGVLRRLRRDVGILSRKLFGPGFLVWKVASAGALGLAAILALTPVDYRVSARTVIEGEIQRVAAAPFDGFIGAAHVRAGDTVKAGQLLAQLDDRELRVEEARWSSEHDQYENRLREAMAQHDLVAMQVLGAQLRQAAAQLALARGKITRARLKAPFDGVVVSGDLSQQVGAPVEAGQTLFEIAPLHRYRVILQVDEREIRHVRIGQSGRIVMTGIAGEAMEFTVAKVTPVATAEEGRNFFRVEALLSGTSPRLRPGMEGVGKIEVGRHSLWWALTHSFTDWLTLRLWAWMP
ncbi:MAG: HlyD family efflux transporter periplasmic adaptor subunit [Zoogloeaceae bacterium]|jgi:RND family efflux transporter MFP subunit|nr:HlyD family efflux transporter periplasmic adaptor subunit [Zoogloeaceae bacterium]